jgi:hypothetical protein
MCEAQKHLGNRVEFFQFACRVNTLGCQLRTTINYLNL